MAVTSNRATAPDRRTVRMTPGRAVVAMTRPSQLLLIWAVYLTGVLLALAGSGSSLEPLPVAVVALLITGAASGAHLVNEAEDAVTDRHTTRTPFSGGSGALEVSGLDPSVPLRLGLLVAGLVAVATLVAWFVLPLPGAAVTIVLVGLVGSLLYSLPPVAAMRHGWGEPLNAVLGGLVLPLAGVAVVAGTIGLDEVLAFVPFTLVALASVMATAWPDRRADAATGKLTMQVRLQPVVLRRIHALASVGFVVATLAVVALDAAPFALAWLVVVPALAVGLATYTRRSSPLPNVAAMVGLAVVLVAANAAGWLAGWPA